MNQRRLPPDHTPTNPPRSESPQPEVPIDRPPTRRGPRVVDARQLTLDAPLRRRPPWTGPLVALVLVLLLPAPSLAADWLILRDGGRLQVAGSWHVEGSMVRFHLPNGTLASLPSAAVDLVRSGQAGIEDGSPAARTRPPVPSRAPWVLTDADVQHAPPAQPARATSPPSSDVGAGDLPTGLEGGSPPSGDVLPRRAPREFHGPEAAPPTYVDQTTVPTASSLTT